MDSGDVTQKRFVWSLLLHCRILTHNCNAMSCIVWFSIFRLHRLHAVYSLLLQMSHILCVVCVSVCWAHRWPVQKWLNWSRCHLRADSWVQRTSLLDGSRSLHWRGHFWTGTCWPIVMCLHMRTFGIVRLLVHVADECFCHCYGWQNGDASCCQISLEAWSFFFLLLTFNDDWPLGNLAGCTSVF